MLENGALVKKVKTQTNCFLKIDLILLTIKRKIEFEAPKEMTVHPTDISKIPTPFVALWFCLKNFLDSSKIELSAFSQTAKEFSSLCPNNLGVLWNLFIFFNKVSFVFYGN